MYNFTLDEQTINLILQALAEQPYKVSAQTIHEIQRQVNEQQYESQE